MTIIIEGDNKEVLAKLLKEEFWQMKILTEKIDEKTDEYYMKISLINGDNPICTMKLVFNKKLLFLRNFNTYFSPHHEYYKDKDWKKQLRMNAEPIKEIIRLC